MAPQLLFFSWSRLDSQTHLQFCHVCQAFPDYAETVREPLCGSLLESIRCHTDDEYPVYSAEDESLIPPLACSFSKGSGTGHILGLVDENGSVLLYNTNLAGEAALVTDWMAHSNAVFDVEWMCREDKLLTASGDQTICLWDVPTETKLLTFKGHSSSVRSVKYRPQDDAVFASGSRDGHVRLWDSRCNVKGDRVSCVSVVKNAHSSSLQTSSKRRKSRVGPAQSQDCQQSVTCVLFQNDHLLTTSGAVDGCIKVWDMRRIKADNNTALYSFPYNGTFKRTHGYSSLTFDTYFTKLFANCTDDVVYCYDFISYRPDPVCTYRGHRNTSFYVKSVLSPDDQFLLSGSSDENAYIWQVSKPNASPVILKGHRSEVSDVAWCKTDLFRVVTTSDDNSLRVWRYDATAEMRKRAGRSDVSCGITGTSERTHRDIGTSVESGQQTPSRQSTLKRSATFPFGPVTPVTPKQAKTRIDSTPSPSIKIWLKRSASDSITAVSGVPVAEVLDANKHELNKDSCSPCSPSKRFMVETDVINLPDSTKGNNENKIVNRQKESERKSCKRKLVEENSPEKCKKQRRQDENCDTERDQSIVIKDKMTPDNHSPSKGEMVLKDLNSDFNTSPVKNGETTSLFSSPVRVPLKEWGSNLYASPTANLPNLVVDGPQRNSEVTGTEEDRKKTVNWLTQMRVQKLSMLSPRSKKCRKLVEKLSDSSSTESSRESDNILTASPRAKGSYQFGLQKVGGSTWVFVHAWRGSRCLPSPHDAGSNDYRTNAVNGVRSITSFFTRPSVKS